MAETSMDRRQSRVPAATAGVLVDSVFCIQSAVRHTLRKLAELSRQKRPDRPRRDGTEHLM